MSWWSALNKKIPRSWKRNPPLTWAMHTLITVLGVVPVPAGLLGIGYFLWTGHSSMWVIGSGLSLLWYWVREYGQNGLRPKLKYKLGPDMTRIRLSFIQRYDPWFDVLFPTLAYGFQLGFLGWLW